ncbi:TIGR03618 family F420-dependent PPOX class oxidoreductase [Agromyces sp. CFH 90414]|uniref:TIGR03618 family F420-dependent PPOX class oxidoreductase n=1 Tax=Agromyces agglutinans TaxID=2662258 RepID=A0A6I2F3Q8_9MICO|nr:PPOX class F420-dependent oxidoreductase [Agromyces agglutinans]MRG58861.1 TIGR03618 family F420-dependent PPOX class oxidoreductase [Agromyces agglutinans]
MTDTSTVTLTHDATRLLDPPNYGMLGTFRPNGELQINPMWFERFGDQLRFTHTTYRGKYRNLQQNPAMTLAVLDPESPFHYVEVRGTLTEVIPDPEGEFYVRLGKRYGNADQEAPADKVDRVVLVMRIEKVNTH